MENDYSELNKARREAQNNFHNLLTDPTATTQMKVDAHLHYSHSFTQFSSANQDEKATLIAGLEQIDDSNV